jgi:hypothetical protein
MTVTTKINESADELEIPSGYKDQVNTKRKRSVQVDEKTSSSAVITSSSPVSTSEESKTEEDADVLPPAPKLYRPMFGVSNAYFLTQPPKGISEDKTNVQDDPDKNIPDIPSLLNPAKTPTPSDLLHQMAASPANLSPKGLINTNSITEQMMQAIQFSNPYLNLATAALQNGSKSSLDSLLSAQLSVSLPQVTSSKQQSVSPTSASASRQFCGLMTSAPVRRYKQYSEDSLQSALKEIMEGQSINRSSMKHNIPARTLRDWMKRLNIKSVFTHHSHNKERSQSQDGPEDGSLGSVSPEPEQAAVNLVSGQAVLAGAADASAFPGMEAILARFREPQQRLEQEQEIDDDEEHTLRIDETPIEAGVQIAQPAN